MRFFDAIKILSSISLIKQNPNNWRPGQLVGGIQSSVNGFVQEITRYIPF